MKEKIKKIAIYAAPALMVLPFAAFAQVSIPSGTGLPGEGGTSLFSIIQNVMRWLESENARNAYFEKSDDI